MWRMLNQLRPVMTRGNHCCQNTTYREELDQAHRIKPSNCTLLFFVLTGISLAFIYFFSPSLQLKYVDESYAKWCNIVMLLQSNDKGNCLSFSTRFYGCVSVCRCGNERNFLQINLEWTRRFDKYGHRWHSWLAPLSIRGICVFSNVHIFYH